MAFSWAHKMDKLSLKEFLDEKADRYERKAFIAEDPVSVPHLFSKKEDIEIAGFFAATIAWGQRVTIVKNALRMMAIMDNDPFAFVMSASENELRGCQRFVHRTFNGEDFKQMILALRKIYKEDGGLEEVLSCGETMFERIVLLNRVFSVHFENPHTNKHVSDPAAGSAAKRINMFVRWMVRKNKRGVDFGIWEKIKPSELICPLDVHTGNVGRKLGLLGRKQNDWLAAEELTAMLRKFDEHDPVKYDFALFGLGVFEKFK